MPPISIFLSSFILWLAAKGRLNSYWKLATDKKVSAASNNPPVTSGANGAGEVVTPSTSPASLVLPSVTDYLKSLGN